MNSTKSDKLSAIAITELLARVSEITKKHELIAEMTGESFNVFDILNLRTHETRTHSAFLRELLDPKGSHGMKDAFLKAFIRILKNTHEHWKEFTLEGWDVEQDLHAEVVTERHISYISEDGSEGGRIDLVLTPKSDGRKILIENKINAIDQNSQLVRYRNFDDKALLLYLTLDGKEANRESTEHPGTERNPESIKLVSQKHYFRISYEKHILEWLEECRKEASCRPLVRETIAQYITLVRHLTHQNPTSKMSDEITKTVLASPESYEAARAIQKCEQAIKSTILDKLSSQITNLGADLGLIPYTGFDMGGKAYQGFGFHMTAWEAENIYIGFSAGSRDFNDWEFGFGREPDKSNSLGKPDSILVSSLNERFCEKFKSSNESVLWWVAHESWRGYSSWDDATFVAINFGNGFIGDLKKLLINLLVVAQAAGVPGDYQAIDSHLTE